MRATALLGVAATGHTTAELTVRGQEPGSGNSQAIDIGSRRELFVDQYLVERLDGVRLELHRPMRREVVFRTDAPWEGNGSCYQSVFRDGDLFRMYYRGGHHVASKAYEREKNSWETLCLAESRDGIHWTRPELDIVEFQGSTKNNLILDSAMVSEIGGSPAHTAAFKDTNPDCSDEERYKIVIVGSKPRGLYLLVSADGVHFQLKSQQPFTTIGAFDSQNLMFWDSVGKVYREYHRQFDQGVRGIMTAASTDPSRFPEPRWLEYPGAVEQALYTNQIQPYYRAPHLYLATPTRFVPGRGNSPDYDRKDVNATDILLMSSRAGSTSYDRLFTEALIRPGLDPARWGNRANYAALNLVPTGPDEISLYHRSGDRYVFRLDGFVAVHAGSAEGQLLTKPITFTGRELVLNFSTGAVGGIRVELQSPAGEPLRGFSLDDCTLEYGDSTERVLRWKGGDLTAIAGTPVRLRFALTECDLYSFRFRMP